jgi:NADH:ubiquinone oxidoreductase subunit F (NADH-binding)
VTNRILAGPAPELGAERYADHLRRLGPLPGPTGLLEALERSGLRGRGGAAFPVAAKWRSIANRDDGPAVVVANGSEGEPLSHKDRVLMSRRPHLVLDGALLAARVLRADRALVVVAENLEPAPAALSAALGERPAAERDSVRLIIGPARYVSGESSAIVSLVNSGTALPTYVPPRPHAKGVARLPTLVQNVESLAQVALVARQGVTAPTLLTTLHAAGSGPTVRELEPGTPLGRALEGIGGSLAQTRAVLLGGYFGTWIPAGDAWELPLDPGALRERGHSLGCGVVAALPVGSCGVCETARILRYLAGESSAQCGPCFFGLAALAGACERIAANQAEPGELRRLHRWATEVRGRGACHHPDGASELLLSALRVFGPDFENHRRHGRGGLG